MKGKYLNWETWHGRALTIIVFNIGLVTFAFVGFLLLDALGQS